VEMRKHILCFIVLLTISSSGCSYLSNRGNDFFDCFKATADVGLGASAHVQVGPIAAGTGLWTGYSFGLEQEREIGRLKETYVGFPVGHIWFLLDADSYLDFIQGDISSREHGKGYLIFLYGLASTSAAKQKWERTISGEREGCFARAVLFLQIPKYDKWTEYFWIEASARCFIGAKIGFNIAEFADFILGWFGLDSADDDEKEEQDRAEQP